MGELVHLISTLVRPLRIDAYIEYTVDAGIEPLPLKLKVNCN